MRIISTYNVFSTTADEPAHIACGLEYVANHVYKLEVQHPPLTRAMIALLPYLDGTRPRGIPNFQNEGWAIITYERHPERTLFLMRLGNLPFFILGGLETSLVLQRRARDRPQRGDQLQIAVIGALRLQRDHTEHFVEGEKRRANERRHRRCAQCQCHIYGGR